MTKEQKNSLDKRVSEECARMGVSVKKYKNNRVAYAILCVNTAIEMGFIHDRKNS